MNMSEMLPREIKMLVIHCSATRCNVPFTVSQLDTCHRKRGFDGIGYHFYITRDGGVHATRPLERIGAHAKGFNLHSVGICYEGGLDADGKPADTRTWQQRDSMNDLIYALRHAFGDVKVLGHYQLSADIHKACPCFDARKEYFHLPSQ